MYTSNKRPANMIATELEERFQHHFALALQYANELEVRAAEEPAPYPATQPTDVPQPAADDSSAGGGVSGLGADGQRAPGQVLHKHKRHHRRTA